MIDIVVDIEVNTKQKTLKIIFDFFLGFGFVTFADMATTKIVCSTRIFNLHGRKV